MYHRVEHNDTSGRTDFLVNCEDPSSDPRAAADSQNRKAYVDSILYSYHALERLSLEEYMAHFEKDSYIVSGSLSFFLSLFLSLSLSLSLFLSLSLSSVGFLYVSWSMF